MELELGESMSEQKKMMVSTFIFNALQDGWKVQKKNENYIFSKRKGKNKEVYTESFLHEFLKKNFEKEL